MLYRTLVPVLVLCVLGACDKQDTAKLIGNYVYAIKSKDTKSISRKSHMHCFIECMARKTCVFISSTLLTKGLGVISRHNPYKCHLYLSRDVEPVERKKTCSSQNQPIEMFPRAIAGACSEHKCAASEICIPLKYGSYRCKPEKRRRNKRKTKGHKAT